MFKKSTCAKIRDYSAWWGCGRAASRTTCPESQNLTGFKTKLEQTSTIPRLKAKK
jgi:hypothetical protein